MINFEFSEDSQWETESSADERFQVVMSYFTLCVSLNSESCHKRLQGIPKINRCVIIIEGEKKGGGVKMRKQWLFITIR